MHIVKGAEDATHTGCVAHFSPLLSTALQSVHLGDGARNDAYGGVPCVGVDYEEAVCQARECPVTKSARAGSYSSSLQVRNSGS